MKPFIQAAAILTAAMIAAAITWAVSPPAEATACDPSAIQADEICLQSIPEDKQVLWIDARPRSDWENNGLEGSILWNFDPTEDFNAMEAEAVMKIFETPYVVIYCADQGCGTSRKIAKHITTKLQLEAEVHVLHNGWKALEAAGKTLEP